MNKIPSFMWTLPRDMQKKLVQCSEKFETKKNVRILFSDMRKSREIHHEEVPELIVLEYGTTVSEVKTRLKLENDTKLIFNGVEVQKDWKFESTNDIGCLFAVPTFTFPSNDGFLTKKTKKKLMKNTKKEKNIDSNGGDDVKNVDNRLNFMEKYAEWCELKDKSYNERAKQMKQLNGVSRIVRQADIDDSKMRNKRNAAQIMQGSSSSSSGLK